MCSLYVDNTRVFRCQQLARIGASLRILIIQSAPYQPEGRGKIERYFRYVREGFWLTWIAAVGFRWRGGMNGAWTDHHHLSQHASLGTTPLLRKHGGIEWVRQPPPDCAREPGHLNCLNRIRL